MNQESEVLYNERCREIGEMLIDCTTSRFTPRYPALADEAFNLVCAIKQFQEASLEAIRKDAKRDAETDCEKRIEAFKFAMRKALQKASLATPESVITFRELSEILKPFCE